MLKDFFKFFFKKDSCTASLIIIYLANYMSNKDLQQMSDYLFEVKQHNNYLGINKYSETYKK